MSSQDAINRHLNNFFRNGRPEVGLEVGADPGLSPEDYIHIPSSFKKSWAYRKVGAAGHGKTSTDTLSSLQGKTNWEQSAPGAKHVLISNGKYYIANEDGTRGEEIDDFHIDPPTYDDVRRFIAANTGHVRDRDLSMEEIWWVHSTRFWSLVTGLVSGSKQTEYVVVPDPTVGLDATNDIVDRVIAFQDNALTAAAARAASWRKSNHATGGEKAAGFPRRWLQRNGYWPMQGERAAKDAGQLRATAAFYVATHAICVHNALAMMAPTDDCHWAKIDPSFGMSMGWDIRESAMIRIAPKEQVAGTAMVVDAVVVLRMLVSEGLYSLLESQAQWQALYSAYEKVAANGIKVASYASWFLSGHPDGYSRIQFGQKDAQYSTLIGELGAAGKHYYARSTIGDSPALDNAMQQLATETAKLRWTALARAKSSSSNEAVVTAYKKIAGTSASDIIRDIVSDDRATVEAAVTRYNIASRAVAERIGVGQPATLNADEILASDAGVTPATSAASTNA